MLFDRRHVVSFVLFIAVSSGAPVLEARESDMERRGGLTAAEKRAPTELEGIWRRSVGDDLLWAGPRFVDGQWRSAPLPATWLEQELVGHAGAVWYRRQVFLDESRWRLLTAGRLGVLVGLGGFGSYELFVNGEKVGEHGFSTAVPPPFPRLGALASGERPRAASSATSLPRPALRAFPIPAGVAGEGEPEDPVRLTVALRFLRVRWASDRAVDSGPVGEMLRFGELAELERVVSPPGKGASLTVPALLACALIVIGGGCLGLFWRLHTNRQILWTGLSVIGFGIHTFAGSREASTLTSDMVTAERLAAVAFHGASICLLEFARELTDDPVRPWLGRFQIGHLLLGVAVLVVPSSAWVFDLEWGSWCWWILSMLVVVPAVSRTFLRDPSSTWLPVGFLAAVSGSAAEAGFLFGRGVPLILDPWGRPWPWSACGFTVLALAMVLQLQLSGVSGRRGFRRSSGKVEILTRLKALRGRYCRLRKIQRVNQEIAEAGCGAEAVQRALAGLRKVLETSGVGTFLVDREGKLRTQAVCGLAEGFLQGVEAIGAGPPRQPDSEAGDGKEPDVRVVREVASEPLPTDFAEACRDAGVEAFCFLPLRSRGSSTELLGIFFDRPRQLGAEEVGLGRCVARQLVNCLRRGRVGSRAEEEALCDPLTSLPNRTQFRTRLTEAVQAALQDPGARFAVLFIDLDRFRNINESLGHDVGDRLLTRIARRLDDILRDSDLVARFGGDEFTILLEGLQDTAEDAVRIALRIRERLSMPLRVQGTEVVVTASIGIALSDTGYYTAQEVLRDADIALYRAKAAGRGSYNVLDPNLHSRAVAQLRLELSLRRAVERGELTLVYQPIISLAAGEVVEFEALLRWRHPQQGMLLPEEFLPQIAEAGLALAVGDWVLREACQQAARWQVRFAGGAIPSVVVNLFDEQLVQPDCVTRIQKVLRDTGLRGERLHLDVRESALIESPTVAEETLRGLEPLPIRVYLDDFGAGYSALSCLRRFSIDGIKLDRSFIADLDSEGCEIVHPLVLLAHNLDLEVVAEGIETDQQLSTLRRLGCEFGQGFLISEPLEGMAAEELYAAEWARPAPMLESVK